jgi:hypothetical protein
VGGPSGQDHCWGLEIRGGEEMGSVEGIADAARVRQDFSHSAPSKKNQNVAEIILFVAIFAIFVVFGLHGMTDAKYSMLVSENLLHNHTFVMDERSMPRLEPFARPGYKGNGYPYQIEVSHGKVLYVYPVGTSILSLPFVIVMNIVGVSAHTPDGRYNEAGEQAIEGYLDRGLPSHRARPSPTLMEYRAGSRCRLWHTDMEYGIQGSLVAYLAAAPAGRSHLPDLG